MDKTVKFGIVGVGNMGLAHLKTFVNGKVAGGEVTAVADIDASRLKAASEISKQPLALYDSGEELIDRADVDAVIVATPHYSHPGLSIRALKRGIHTICEKPPGVYTKQVREMNECAKNSEALFGVMFNQRTNPVYIKMRELILSGEIGEIKRVNWIITDWYRSQSYYDSGSWRATWAGEGGGVLLNQCPHQLDLLQWITGMMPSRVKAFCHFGKWHDIEVEDDVTAYFEYGNGATGVFVTSTADTPGTNRLEILGTNGKVLYDTKAGERKIILYKLQQNEREFNKSYRGGFGEPAHVVVEIAAEGENSQHAGIFINFVKAVNGREKLLADGSEGLRCVELMDSMLLSTWLDKFVELPFDEELYLAELNKRIKSSKKKSVKSAVLNVDGTY